MSQKLCAKKIVNAVKTKSSQAPKRVLNPTSTMSPPKISITARSYGQSLAPNDPLYLRATTACLTAIIVMQIVNVFLCRSSVRSVFLTGFFGNRLIVLGVILEMVLALAINYTSAGNWLLGTAPVPGELWLLLIALGAAMLVLEELRKWVSRKLLHNSTKQ